ncbi:MAG: cob(I)yrinic acid a,c-diamide adenosyltransferase [Acidimicrobiia bacterium]|nr:MAG: cob(I)yrinic acid a,c-diamide adenosyltransferase [Acidimicrobiia bacterium]
MRVYTRTGDDGETSLRWGRRVGKADPLPVAYGSVDEAQAAVGLARAEAGPDGELDPILTRVCRDLWVLMAELATAPEDRPRLEAGKDLVTPEMVSGLEGIIDRFSEAIEPPRGFVVPGQNRLAAHLDFARTVVRRAEREVVRLGLPDSSAVPYLNRLADLLWVLARWAEGEPLPVRQVT